MGSVSSFFLHISATKSIYKGILSSKILCRIHCKTRQSISCYLISTRCKDTYLNGFCLDVIYSCSSENFYSPYYRSYTMDAYQNLISGNNPPLGVQGNCFGWLECMIHTVENIPTYFMLFRPPKDTTTDFPKENRSWLCLLHSIFVISQSSFARWVKPLFSASSGMDAVQMISPFSRRAVIVNPRRSV